MLALCCSGKAKSRGGQTDPVGHLALPLPASLIFLLLALGFLIRKSGAKKR